jgi:Spy/CpxP family protein refolding chaperone
MTASSVFLLLLVLACPLMMIFMMRGGHGHGSGQGGHAGGCHGGSHGPEHESHQSIDELRRQRDELDRQIGEREAEEETPTVVGTGQR